MTDWNDCKNILCIRPDNLGDLIMSSPAIRALKETFESKITVLTSSVAAGIVPHIAEIDELIIFDVPWVKNDGQTSADRFDEIVRGVKSRQFDAAVIFTVYSQNPLPTVMIPYLAEVPKRLAYCRENPYQLLTNWVPDKEPYNVIKHQVRRDLDLVATIGAQTKHEALSLTVDERLNASVQQKLIEAGVDMDRPWLILHPGVSETKRLYNADQWAKAARRIIDELGYQILLTGVRGEQSLTECIQTAVGPGAFSLAGIFSLSEFIWLISKAPLLLSVNTGTLHIAAATGTPTVVLYALTNPQHTPWKVPCRVLTFPVSLHLQSKNEVVAHVGKYLHSGECSMPGANDIVTSVKDLLNGYNTVPVGVGEAILMT